MKAFVILSIAVFSITFPIYGLAKDIEPTVLRSIAILGGDPDKIEPGEETQALVRYVNDKVLGKYDRNHDKKITGDEAQKYVDGEVAATISEEELARLYNDAYVEAEKRFKGGVDVSDIGGIEGRVPIVQRTQGFAFGLSYGQKGEAGKDTEAMAGSIEYKWGAYALVGLPYQLGTKLSYGKDNTFVTNNTNKVERWTIQPLSLSFGTDEWFAKPSIGLGYGRSRTEEAVDGITSIVKDDEFVWEVGLEYPIRIPDGKGSHTKVAALTMSKTIRLDNPTSGKENDQFKLGFKIGKKEFKKIRKIIRGK